jgi:hypothetical protein
MTTASHPRVEGRNLIGGRWIPVPGDAMASRMPAAPARVVWSGTPASSQVDEAPKGWLVDRASRVPSLYLGIADETVTR